MDGEAPGWDAIEARLGQLFPTQHDPLHWGTSTLPDQDGVYGISAYRDDTRWTYVTFGLTELFGKVSDDPSTSGWGFELVLRAPAEAEDAPPWPVRLLHQLGRYVFTTGSPFGPGHRVDLGGPLTGAPDTRLTAVAFAADPQLDPIDTPNGSVDFLAVVGITAEELALMKATSTDEVLRSLADRSPLLVTDPER